MGKPFRSWPAVRDRSRRIAASGVVLALAGCATPPPPDEPVVESVPPHVETVALAAFHSSIAEIEPERVEAAFEGRFTERLTGWGIEVIPSAVWRETWRRYAEDVGGVYDRSSGQADEKKFEAVREAVYRDLVERYSVDAILYVDVKLVEHFGVRVLPQVCGETVTPYWPGGWSDHSQARSPAILVRSSCLVGVLVDPGGKSLFGRQCGIEGMETYDVQTRSVRPPDRALSDEVKLDRATSVVLAPFANAAPPASGAGGGPAGVTPTDRP